MNKLMRVGILAFLHRETHGINRKLLVLTAASGIANALNLAVINAAIEALRQGGPSWQHLVWFGLSISLFVYSLRYVLYESTRIAEAAICSVRVPPGRQDPPLRPAGARIDRRGRYSRPHQPRHRGHRPGGATAFRRRTVRRNGLLHDGIHRRGVAGRHAALPGLDRGRHRQSISGTTRATKPA